MKLIKILFLTSIASSTFAYPSFGVFKLNDLLFLLAFMIFLLKLGKEIKIDVPKSLFVVMTVSVLESLINIARNHLSEYQSTRILKYGYLGYIGTTDWPNFISWNMNFILLPILAINLVRLNIIRIEIAMKFYVSGVIISVITAYLNFFNIAQNIPQLNSISFSSNNRESGLTTHPNLFGISIIFAIPMIFFLFDNRKIILLFANLFFLGGIILSGSRTALLGYCFVVFSVIFIYSRSYISRIISVFSFLFIMIFPAIAIHSLEKFQIIARFGSADAQESNQIRKILLHIAFDDINHSFIIGNGIQFLKMYNNIYLQILSFGGFILLASIVKVNFDILSTSYQYKDDKLIRILMINHFVWLAIGLTSNAITESFLFFPLTFLICRNYLIQTSKKI